MLQYLFSQFFIVPSSLIKSEKKFRSENIIEIKERATGS